MNIQAAIFEALESLNANKVRTGLTILGIVIGVAAVIAMLAVGAGAQDTITGSINGIGTNLLFVFPGNMQEKVNNIKPLSQGDINAICGSLSSAVCRCGGACDFVQPQCYLWRGADERTGERGHPQL